MDRLPQLETLCENTFLRSLEHHEELGSTNDRALELAAQLFSAGPATELEGDQGITVDDLPRLIWASRQTAGRGRGANAWWAAEGALTFSLLFNTQALRLPPERLSAISLVAGLAVLEGLQPYYAPGAWRLKWPNDIYLDERKICGILAEAPRPNCLVLGIGINVNNSFSGLGKTDNGNRPAAPPEVQARAVALIDRVGQALPMLDVLVSVLRSLGSRWDWYAGQATSGPQPAGLAQAWAPYCLLTGRAIEVTLGAERIVGVCAGVDDRGVLRLATPQGERAIVSGIVSGVAGLRGFRQPGDTN